MLSYFVPRGIHRVEETVKQSRFIATVAHTPARDDAKIFISQIRDEFSDATHNCRAFVAGPPGSTDQIGMSDDGEPHGTAGRPLLNMLLHSGVGEVSVVVTRYFGGIRLGTGGLVRAYSGMVRKALSTLNIKEKIISVCVSVTVNYSNISAFRHMAKLYEAKIRKETYATDASFILELPEEKAEAFRVSMLNLNNGETTIKKI
ncbi:YigZ family protein [Desulfonema magnum]|uniref:Impact family protein n=1 Tax=Desulfonema magnum TaxID=45655 RepID=A0A975BHV0_9BACT|nr:YigZ family protein [Desulfonema magnum]QTA85641.1 Impact family protein [Desulfonema magnum]